MKKIVKRLISLSCVAALAASCCIGASAASYSGSVGGYSWSASNTWLDRNMGFFRAWTNGGWSPVYNGSVRVRANYDNATGPGQTDGWVYADSGKTSVTYDCIHYPSISNQSSDHYASLNGDVKSHRLYPS